MTCQICLPRREAGEKRLWRLEKGGREIVAISKPGGGSNEGIGFVDAASFWALLKLANAVKKVENMILCRAFPLCWW